MTVGERIKERRKELGISVDDIAARLGKNRATVYRYESNSIENMPVGALEPLAEILRTTPAQLLGIPEGTDAESVLAIMQDGESGRFHAREEMFRLYGKDYGVNSTRLMDENMSVLFYHSFPDRDAAATFSYLLDQLASVSGSDLDAIFGMVMGYLQRDELRDQLWRRKKSAASGGNAPEAT